MPASMVYLVPNQDERRRRATSARSPCSRLGWPAQRRRAKAHRRSPLGAAPSPGAARPSLSGARYAPGATGAAIASGRHGLRRDLSRLSRDRARLLPAPSLQCPIRSSTPAGGSGRAYEARARCAGARHSGSACDQPAAAQARARLGRPLPLTHASQPARGPERARVRTAELSEASPRFSGTRSALFGSLVPRMGHQRCAAVGTVACGSSPDVAGTGRLAATRLARREGIAAESVTASFRGTATGTGLV